MREAAAMTWKPVSAPQRTVRGVPAPVRRHPGRHPHVLRPAAPEPVLRRRRLRRHDAVHERAALAVRTEPPVPRVRRHHQEPEQHRQADLRLDAVRGEQALGEGRHHQRQLHVGAAVDRDRRLRGRGLGSPERGALLLAPQASHRRVRRVGTALVPRRAQPRRVSPRRLVDGAGAGLPERPAVGHARQRRTGAGRRTSKTSRCQGKKDGQFIYGVEAVHRPAQRDDRQLRSAVGLDGVRLHGALLPDPRRTSSAARR